MPTGAEPFWQVSCSHHCCSEYVHGSWRRTNQTRWIAEGRPLTWQEEAQSSTASRSCGSDTAHTRHWSCVMMTFAFSSASLQPPGNCMSGSRAEEIAFVLPDTLEGRLGVAGQHLSA